MLLLRLSVVTLLLAPAILAQPSDHAVKLRERLEQIHHIADAAGFADAAQKIELTLTSRMRAGSS